MPLNQVGYVLHLVKATVSQSSFFSADSLILAAFVAAGMASAYFLLKQHPAVAEPIPQSDPSDRIEKPPVARVHVRLEGPVCIPAGKPAMGVVAKAEACLACGQSLDYAARIINPSYAHWSPRQQKQYVAYLRSGVSELTLAATNGCIVTVN